MTKNTLSEGKRYFDLHCDTATMAFHRGITLEDEKLHVNKKALGEFEEAAQVFAVFYSENRTDPGMEFFFNVKSFLEKEAAGIPNLRPIISCEGGNVTEGKIENVQILAENGVKFFSLVWNGDSFFATGSKTDQNTGLKPLARDCVNELENCGIIPDVSHLSDAGFCDMEKICKGPFVATHSNSRSIFDCDRNLTDSQIKVISERGGLIGLNLYPRFLNGTENADMTDILRHAEHMLNLGCENVLALGCDFDGIDCCPRGVENVAGLANLKDCFTREFGKELSHKIIYGNANDFCDKHL